MRKVTEKIALVAMICIGLIFILFIILIPLGAIDATLFGNWLVKILLGILAVLFAGLSIYLLIMNFSNSGKLRELLLFSDVESSTKTTAKVIRSVVNSEGRKIKGVKVLKTKITQDDKYGFKLKIYLAIANNDVEECIDKLRCMIADSFYNGLGVRFNSIDFVIKRLRTKYLVDEKEAEKQAKILKAKRGCSKEYVHDAMEPIYDEEEKKEKQELYDILQEEHELHEQQNVEKAKEADKASDVETVAQPTELGQTESDEENHTDDV